MLDDDAAEPFGALCARKAVCICGFVVDAEAARAEAVVARLVATLPEPVVARRLDDALREQVALYLGRPPEKTNARIASWDEALRATDPDVWIVGTERWLRQRIHTFRPDAEEKAETIVAARPLYVLIPDVRYENEIKWLREAGGVTVRLRDTPDDDRADAAAFDLTFVAPRAGADGDVAKRVWYRLTGNVDPTLPRSAPTTGGSQDCRIL